MEGPFSEESMEDMDSSRLVFSMVVVLLLLVVASLLVVSSLVLVVGGVRGENEGGCSGISDGKSCTAVLAPDAFIARPSLFNAEFN